MVIPDLNLIVYAHVPSVMWHDKARRWWEDLLNSGEPVGIATVVRLGFVRLLGNSAVVENPLPPERAIAITQAWFAQPWVEEISPVPGHYQLLAGLMQETGLPGRHVNDAHLAALARERRAEIHSNDTDFARFSGVKVVNPLR